MDPCANQVVLILNKSTKESKSSKRALKSKHIIFANFNCCVEVCCLHDVNMSMIYISIIKGNSGRKDENYEHFLAY